MYTPRTTPREHQRKALTLHLAHPQAFALLAEMGTGKSKIILDEFGTRVTAGELDDLLIIAPAGSYRNWDEDKSDEQPSQFKAHLAPELFERLKHAAWISGGRVADRQKLDAVLAYRAGPRALLVNVEALSSVTAARDACLSFLAPQNRHAMIVVDESTTIKNHKAKRTKVVHDLGKLADSRRILTGLVTPRSPLDLYAQFEFLDWQILGFKSYYAFRARYAILKEMVMGGRRFKTVVGYRNSEELQRKIAPHSYRVLKEDCLDLPPKIYQTRDVRLTDEQARMYREIHRFATTEFESQVHVTATAVITQIIRLHQLLCGFVVDENGDIHDVPSNRINDLLELLEEHSGKAIIWCTYQKSLQDIVKRLSKEYGAEAVATFHGGNRNTRGEDERRFLGDPKCRFMVATPGAGGKGNTWVNASLVIYFANDDNLELRMQSEDRSHRDGLKHSVTYVDLMVRKTVDEKRVEALRKKINMASVINGENYREWLI